MNDETFIRDMLLAGTIKSRLRRHCQINEVDDLFEVYRYSIHDEIRAHFDRGRVIKNGVQSNATLLVYLSQDFLGGRTIFTNDRTILPALGRAIMPLPSNSQSRACFRASSILLGWMSRSINRESALQSSSINVRGGLSC